MKKFFLSAAVMLAAVTMNANAMSDSWLFDSTPDEIASQYKTNDDYYYKVKDEVYRLALEVSNSTANDRNSRAVRMMVQSCGYSLSLRSALELLFRIKATEN